VRSLSAISITLFDAIRRRAYAARMGKKDRPRIDPFSIEDAEVFVAALHQDWGEAQVTTRSSASSPGFGDRKRSRSP
jgi:hypothetical protein